MAAHTDILCEAPEDGYCGVNTLVEILNNKQLDFNSQEIKKLLDKDSAL